MVCGFGGLRDHGGRLSFAPRLPSAPDRAQFTVRWHGHKVRVTAGPDRAHYSLAPQTRRTAPKAVATLDPAARHSRLACLGHDPPPRPAVRVAGRRAAGPADPGAGPTRPDADPAAGPGPVRPGRTGLPCAVTRSVCDSRFDPCIPVQPVESAADGGGAGEHGRSSRHRRRRLLPGRPARWVHIGRRFRRRTSPWPATGPGRDVRPGGGSDPTRTSREVGLAVSSTRSRLRPSRSAGDIAAPDPYQSPACGQARGGATARRQATQHRGRPADASLDGRLLGQLAVQRPAVAQSGDLRR